MALATLSVDLVANLARFESEMGRAARVAEQAANRIDRSFGGVGAVFAGSLLATAAKEVVQLLFQLVPALVGSVARFQDLEEATGASAVGLAAFQTAADVAGVSTDQLAGYMVKLTAGLSKTNDESKGAGLALRTIGLELESFRRLSPDRQFEELAQALAQFEDGAGKTAIAVTLLGKGGAEALPFLKELADSGRSQIRLTAEQIRQADALADRNARLRSELRQAAQFVALQALPAFSQLSSELLKAAGSALGLENAAEALQRNSAIREYAESTAIAMATVAESIGGVIRLVRALAGSFESVAADIEFLGTVAKRLNPATGGAAGLLFEENRLELAAALEKRNRVAREANERYVRLFTESGTQISDALRKQFAQQAAIRNDPEAAREDQRLRERAASINLRRPLNFREPDESALREAEQRRQAILQDAVKGIEARFQAERDLYAFRGRFLDAQYQAGLVSVRDYYREKQAIERAAGEAEARRFEEEAARRRQSLPADQSARIKAETDIADLEAKAVRARLQSARDLQLGLLEEERAYVQLTDRVREFAAQLLELEGDAAGAARLRAEAAILTAQRTSASLGLDERQLAAFARATRASVELGEAQRQLGLVSQRAAIEEERFLVAAQQRGASLQEVEQGLFSIRTRALEQLGQLVAQAEALARGAGPDSPAVQFAQQLRLEFEAAAAAVDPARQRIIDGLQEISASVAHSIEDALIDQDWERAGEQILRDLQRGLLRENFTEPLQQALNEFLRTGVSGAGSVTEALGNAVGRAFGGAQTSAQEAFRTGEIVAQNAAAATASAQLTQLGFGALGARSALDTIVATSAQLDYALIGVSSTAQAASTALALLAVNASGGGKQGDALSAFLNLIGFDAGGYTGPAGVTQPAGVVHGQEYVFSAPAVRNLGVGYLERLHRGARAGAPRTGLAGYADGGLVLGTPRVFRPQAAPAMPPRVVIQHRNEGTPKRVVEEQPARATPDGYVVSLITRDIEEGGPISRSIERRHNLQRATPRRS